MNLPTQLPTVIPPHVDPVLDEIARALQITPTQFSRAEQAYRAVGDWLREDGPLAAYEPEVFPQGSMALRTTVRPMGDAEFDLDLVVQVDGWRGSAMDLYDATGGRLKANGTYSEIVEGMKRCWRLNYAGDFHLDALPGRDDPARQGNSIAIPDRDLEDWCPTNPRDFAAWFDKQAQPYYRALMEGKVEPLVAPDAEEAHDPLRRSVQLLKRHRDVRFEKDPELAPRSIVLTTLAAEHYEGEPTIALALAKIVAGMQARIAASEGPFKVPNPVNPDENFADRWDDHPEEYQAFVDYAEGLVRELQGLLRAPFGVEFKEQCSAVFGKAVTEKATGHYEEKAGRANREAIRNIAVGSGASSPKPWCSV